MHTDVHIETILRNQACSQYTPGLKQVGIDHCNKKKGNKE